MFEIKPLPTPIRPLYQDTRRALTRWMKQLWLPVLTLLAHWSIATAAITSTTAELKLRYAEGIVTLSQSHDYFKKQPAHTYWKMAPFYIGQYTDSSCSLATATILVNTIQGHNLIYANYLIATEQGMLERTHDSQWAEWTKTGGIGASLDQMKELIPKALRAFGIKKYNVSTVHVNNISDAVRDNLQKVLLESEKSGQTFIVVNFDHSIFSFSKSVGHFSPVGAYDAEKKLVLVMDTYRRDFEPYWVPLDLLLKGMMTKDNEAKDFRGYLVVRAAK